MMDAKIEPTEKPKGKGAEDDLKTVPLVFYGNQGFIGTHSLRPDAMVGRTVNVGGVLHQASKSMRGISISAGNRDNWGYCKIDCREHPCTKWLEEDRWTPEQLAMAVMNTKAWKNGWIITEEQYKREFAQLQADYEVERKIQERRETIKTGKAGKLGSPKGE